VLVAFLAKLGPMLGKYWQNLFTITTGSVSSILSHTNKSEIFGFDCFLLRIFEKYMQLLRNAYQHIIKKVS
jgi:hypothetical protein